MIRLATSHKTADEISVVGNRVEQSRQKDRCRTAGAQRAAVGVDFLLHFRCRSSAVAGCLCHAGSKHALFTMSTGVRGCPAGSATSSAAGGDGGAPPLIVQAADFVDPAVPSATRGERIRRSSPASYPRGEETGNEYLATCLDAREKTVCRAKALLCRIPRLGRQRADS